MLPDDVISDEVFQSLLKLDEAASVGVAHRIALATLAGACRAICELNQLHLDEDRLRQVVLVQLRQASPLCQSIFATPH